MKSPRAVAVSVLAVIVVVAVAFFLTRGDDSPAPAPTTLAPSTTLAPIGSPNAPTTVIAGELPITATVVLTAGPACKDISCPVQIGITPQKTYTVLGANMRFKSGNLSGAQNDALVDAFLADNIDSWTAPRAQPCADGENKWELWVSEKQIDACVTDVAAAPFAEALTALAGDLLAENAEMLSQAPPEGPDLAE